MYGTRLSSRPYIPLLTLRSISNTAVGAQGALHESNCLYYFINIAALLQTLITKLQCSGKGD